AVLAVANRVAREIREREPNAVAEIGKIVEPIPDKFREKGDEALAGFDSNLPQLLASIDEQVQQVGDSLAQQAEQANQQLDTLGAQLSAQIDSMETTTIARAEAVGPEAEAQIDSCLAIALAAVDAGVTHAVEQIDMAIEQGVDSLLGAQAPSAKSCRKLGAQVIGFVNSTKERTLNALTQTGDSMIEEMSGIESATSDGLQSIEQGAATALQTFDGASVTALTQLADGLDRTLTQSVAALDEGFAAMQTKIEAGLAPAVERLDADFGRTLLQAKGKMGQVVNEAMGKNDEALAELGPKMNEAGEDAGWDYDHPILSTLRDIGMFVGGMIVGIVLVLLVVVVFLVLAEVLIAGLVAVGVSAATAALIVEIGGLLLMAYMGYEAYESRRGRGESGPEAFIGALGDITGITLIYQSVTEEGLSPFERGEKFGTGLATLALILVGGAEGEAGEVGELGELGEVGELGELGEVGEVGAGETPVETPTETPTETPGETPTETTSETPTEKTPAEEAPPEKTPGEETPPEKTPAEDTPPEKTPPEETPPEKTPPEETPPEKTPGEEKPPEEKAPEEKTPDEKTPEETPAEEKPAEEKPAEESKHETNNEDEHLEDAEDTEPYAEERKVICFPAGTPVSTVDGLRRIESLREGDAVYAFDFDTKSVVVSKVLALIKGSTSRWVDIHLGADVLRATPRHPVWVESSREWVKAGELTPGMELRLQDGRLVAVEYIETIPVEGEQETFNLHVEEVNNFFAGRLRVLVHNISAARQARLSRGGYNNYVLKDASGKIYYSGMYNKNSATKADVEARHAANNDRYNPKNGDKMEIISEDKSYGKSRLLETQVAEANETIIGRDPDTFRGNRQKPLADSKRAEYEDFVEKCG
ncbi:MAG: hypothetical protein QOJ76_360, partial [Acidobacteriota bacterium]|nr:hypothetical protein [Acidobacteriota bacterium]